MSTVPSLWSTCPLREVVTLQRGFDLPARLRKLGDVPIVSSSGVSGLHHRSMVRGPGVVTGRYGTIGEVFYVEGDFWPLNTTLWVSDFHGNHARFIYYLLHELDFASHSGKSGVPGVNRNDLHQLVVCLPAGYAAQEQIAEVLTDIDHQIAILERLLAKKKAIKQGLMQQLLTGGTRLPGLIVPWCEFVVADLAQIVNGGTPRSSVSTYWNGGIAWCTPTDITSEPTRYLRKTERTISRAGLKNSSAYLLPKGSLLLCTRATIGDLKIALGPVTTNQGFKSLIPKPNVSSEFLYYKLLTLKDVLTGFGTGSTFLEISKRDIAGLRIAAPPFEEQSAIARVLMDADDEIDALRSRLAKTKFIKQGMMQELLTGRTRLPPAEEEENS